MNIDLSNKIVLVTGASRGIGKAIAIHLAKTGATVVGTATTATGADAISTYFAQASCNGYGMTLNVADKTSIDALFSRLQEENLMPSILVNNAAVTRDNLLLSMDEDEWFDVINTDLNSLYYLSKHCLRTMMRGRWGRIINISSVVGLSGNPGQSNYCAAKAGMIGFTKSLAAEMGSRNITVNAVAPGFIQTDMTNELSEDLQKQLLAKIPLRRLGQADEIASVVAFLASDFASYITGETLSVNGGMYMS